MGVLIDTSVLVAVERGTLAAAELSAWVGPDEELTISVVTLAEMLVGVHRATGRRAQERSARVEGLLGYYEPLKITETVARAYALASAELAQQGTPMDANDLWIGATAIAGGLTVATLGGDFDRIPGVRTLPGPG